MSKRFAIVEVTNWKANQRSDRIAGTTMVLVKRTSIKFKARANKYTNTIIQLTHTTIGKTNYLLPLPTQYDSTKVSYPLRNKELSFSTIRLRRR